MEQPEAPRLPQPRPQRLSNQRTFCDSYLHLSEAPSLDGHPTTMFIAVGHIHVNQAPAILLNVGILLRGCEASPGLCQFEIARTATSEQFPGQGILDCSGEQSLQKSASHPCSAWASSVNT